MKIYRYIIDGLTIVLAIFVFGPYVYYLLPFDYVDTTLPDESVIYEEGLDGYFAQMEPDFQDMFLNPVGTLGQTYTFKTVTDRVRLSPEEIFDRHVYGVVTVEVVDMYGDRYSGGGVILTPDGLIATNYHLIFDADKVAVSLYGGDTYSVTEVIAYDEALDVAFLKIAGEDLWALPVPSEDQYSLVAVGERVYTIGHPEGFQHSFAEGVVSGIRDYSSQGAGTQIQMTNPISAGNSGGALLNTYGELVGIPSWSLEYEDNIVSIQNINFSIPIREALEVLKIRD